MNCLNAFLGQGADFSDFAGSDFGFGGGFNFEIDVFNVDAVVLEGFGDEIEVTGTELFNIKRVFYSDFYITIITR